MYFPRCGNPRRQIKLMMQTMKSDSVARLFRGVAVSVMIFASALPVWAQTYSPMPASTNGMGTNASMSTAPEWLTRPLSMVDALNLTLRQNSGLIKARADLEASRGLVIETRAVALPNLSANA